MPFHDFSHEFQCASLVARLRDEGFQNFVLMTQRAPWIVSLPTDLHKEFFQVPLPSRPLPHSFRSTVVDLVCEISSEPINQVADGFMADLDASLAKQVSIIPR